MNNESVIIDNAFEKEIGIDIDSALKILVKEGISLEDIGKITTDTKNTMANEIERRGIPYEHRFLLINVILCTMFKTTVAFHKEYMKSSGSVSEKIEKKGFSIKFVKEK